MDANEELPHLNLYWGLKERTLNNEASDKEGQVPAVRKKWMNCRITPCFLEGNLENCELCKQELNGTDISVGDVEIKCDDSCPEAPSDDCFNMPERDQEVQTNPHGDEDNKYFCPWCNLSFQDLNVLDGHMKVAHSNEYLELYDKTIHQEQKLDLCDVCGKEFASGYMKHHKRLHTGEKPFMCDVCGIFFVTQGNLVQHRRKHTQEKQNVSEFCGGQFDKVTDLQIHKTTQTGENPYKCDACRKGFARKCDLTFHIVHCLEKFERCDICGFECIRAEMEHHRIKHTGRKFYKCEVCGIEYLQRCHLMEHARMHSWEKHFKCDVCDAAFSKSFSLKIHKLKKHKGESV